MRVTSGWLRAVSAAAVILGGSLAAEAQEIKFWTLSFDNPNVAKAFDTIIKDFEAANPGVTVKLENRGTDEHKSALRVAGGSDQAPDIYFMWAGLGLGGEFVKSGLALPMDKYYAQYKWDDGSSARRSPSPSNMRAAGLACPTRSAARRLYYNKALFQKAGITASRRPTTNSSRTPTSSPRKEFPRSPSAAPSIGTSCG